jgi:hypothetical protein
MPSDVDQNAILSRGLALCAKISANITGHLRSQDDILHLVTASLLLGLTDYGPVTHGTNKKKSDPIYTLVLLN